MKTALAIASLLVLAGCGSQTGSVSDADDVPAAADPIPTAIPAARGTVSSGLATVMDTGRPELCLGAVAESYPPQCDGIPLEGWRWADHKDLYDQSGDIKWGSFAVTGTFDGITFTVTSAVPAALYDPAAEEPVDFSTPCPEPAGGWRVLDPETTTPATYEQVFRTASKLEGYAGAWVDSSRDTRSLRETDQEAAAGDLDVSRFVVNVKVIGDVAAAEEQLRKVWGGMLCVTTAQHTEAELSRISRELDDLPGVLTSSGQFDRADVSVVYDDGSLQAWADATYGEGLVRVDSALKG
jgi:hypothetical protein